MREVAKRENDIGWVVCDKCFEKVFKAKKDFISRKPFIKGEPCDFCGGSDNYTKEQHAFLQLVNFVPEFIPKGVAKSDREAPFLSEAMLYPIMGKDDARSLLSQLRRLARVLEAGEVWHGYKRKKRAKVPRTRNGSK